MTSILSQAVPLGSMIIAIAALLGILLPIVFSFITILTKTENNFKIK